MHEEILLLVEAVEGLKQEPNYIKDYAFPIASALFTSVLGASIAFFTLRHQEGVQIEKDKMNAANYWIMKAEEARASLLAIKGNYVGQLSNDPLQRLAAIPSILFHAEAISENYQTLSFVVPSSKDKSGTLNKWSQIPRIRSMVSNYNYLLKLWEQRNDFNDQFKKKLLNHDGNKAYANLSPNDVLAAIGQADIVVLIDLTERVIRLTDDLIVELDDFLEKFPEYAKTKIQYKRLKKFGSILTYSNNDNEILINMIKISPAVDFSPVELLFGESSEAIKKRHATGYEK